MKNRILVILGMHRSGTSLSTNWLQKCGLNIGSELEGKKFSNPDGHFEDIDFLNLHEEILRSPEVPYHGTENPDNFVISKLQEQRIKKLIDLKNEQSEWGWKDPRTCLFLKTYRKLIPEAYYLVITRPYTEIIDSLLRRNYTPIEKRIKALKLGRLKLIKYRLTLKRQALAEETAYYENAVINYYSSILNHLQSISEEKFICFRLEDIHHLDKEIFTDLKEKKGFSLNYFPISKIFQKKYLKTESKLYKGKTSNSAKLQALQGQLDSYCIASTNVK